MFKIGDMVVEKTRKSSLYAYGHAKPIIGRVVKISLVEKPYNIVVRYNEINFWFKSIELCLAEEPTDILKEILIGI